MRRLVFLLLTLASFGYAATNPPALIHNMPNRTTISLNGAWQAIIDPVRNWPDRTLLPQRQAQRQT
jgi:hypothetical protein